MKRHLLFKSLLLLCALIVGTNAWATNNVSTVTTKFSATGNVTGKFTQTGDFTSAAWNLGVTWKSSASWQNLDSTKGAQVGSGSKPATGIVLTGSSIPGTITSVVVNTSGASDVIATVAVTVGGTGFTCSGNATASLTSSAANYTFTGTGSGDIVITWTNSSSKAIYIKSITTTYLAEEVVAAPTFSPVAGEVTKGSTVTLTQDAADQIRYTLDGTDPTKSTGSVYSSPIVINEATVIKAIAIKGDKVSDITSASYTVSYPGAINITPNFTFFGKSAAFSGTDFNEVTGTTAEGIKVTYTRNGGSLYASTTAMRVYKENTIKIDAPSDKMITRIIFTQSNATDDNLTAAPTEYTNATHTWTGNSSSVTFTRPAKSDSYLQFTKITVVLAAKVTIGTYQWVTYVSDQVMDFTGSDVKAYVVTGASGSAITKTPVTKAAANTPLLLNAPAETYTIPAAATGTNYSTTNKLVAGTGAAVAYDANSGYNYVLSIDNGKAMFMRIVDGTPATVPSGKAYLALDAAPSGARGLNLFDDEDVTGIDATLVNSEKVNSDVFDLSGRKVANPTKGLYIVNGKKYVIK